MTSAPWLTPKVPPPSAAPLAGGPAGGRRWTFSVHARQRIVEMGLRTRDVKRVLAFPETNYPSSLYPDCRTLVGERLAVAVDPVARHVLTVLWRGEEHR